MKAIDLINDLRKALQDVKKDNHTIIPVVGLENYLNNFESIIEENKQSDQESIQREEARKKYQHDFKVWEIQENHKNASDTEMFRSVIEAGYNALKSAIIINGGGAVALIAFLGGLIEKDSTNQVSASLVPSMGYALLVFIFGVGFAGTANGLRYLSLLSFVGSWYKVGCSFTWASIFLGCLSFAAFFTGAWKYASL
jgi:hypothetical protein